MTYLGTSQNGWPVYDTTEHFTRFHVAGVGFWAANDDVATVLGDFIQKYHDTIEPITLPVRESPGRDDWSHAVRPVRGQTTGYSNHGSSTACDTNATRHPRGVHNTYPPAKRKALKRLVDSYDGVLRHGEFYTSTVDGMHVEINANKAKVAAMAAKIRKANAEKENEMSAEDVRQIKDAIPTTAEIAKALKPVIAAEVAAQLKAWQNQPVDLGAFAGGALPKPDGTPSTQHTAGNLLEYSAAHAAEANRNTQAILKRLPDVPADPTH